MSGTWIGNPTAVQSTGPKRCPKCKGSVRCALISQGNDIPEGWGGWSCVNCGRFMGGPESGRPLSSRDKLTIKDLSSLKRLLQDGKVEVALAGVDDMLYSRLAYFDLLEG